MGGTASAKTGMAGWIIHMRGVFEYLIGAMGELTALRNPAVRRVLYRQIYFTGYEALDKVALLGVLVGVMIVTQIGNLVGSGPALTGRILAWTVVRELGPLFTGIIIIARSSTAAAAELGSMKTSHEVSYLVSMGIDPFRYLVVPRVIGFAICLVVLTFYFQAFAVLGGLAVASLMRGISFMQQLDLVFDAVSFTDIAISSSKSLAFGLLISSSSCYHGLRVRGSITEVPQVTSYAVLQSLILIIVASVLVTVTFFL